MQPSEYSAQTAPAIAGYVRAAEQVKADELRARGSFLEALLIGIAAVFGIELKKK